MSRAPVPEWVPWADLLKPLGYETVRSVRRLASDARARLMIRRKRAVGVLKADVPLLYRVGRK